MTTGTMALDFYNLSKNKELTPTEKAVEGISIATNILPYKKLAEAGQTAADITQANYNNFTKGRAPGITDSQVQGFWENFGTNMMGWK
jgi:hypothetical protein